jgi:ATP-dependent helicase/nuclease subunit A
MLRTPTEEQSAVIESPSRKLMVLASAGAGKTYVLVERYLWMIQTLDLRPHQILTITFTKKAAAEMKARIVDRLRSEGLFDHAQEAETGPIQTIHSFCERLLRENSLAAGIDPDFEVLPESDQARIRERCFNVAVANADQPEALSLIRQLAGQSEFGQTSPYARLESSVADVLKEFRGSRTRLADLDKLLTSSGLESSFLQVLSASLPPKVRFALGTEPITMDSVPRLKAAYKQASLKIPYYLSGTNVEKYDPAPSRDAVGLLQLVRSAWSELEFELSRRSAVDYAALESKAVDLVSGSLEVKERLSRQYAAMMVDESQDVNPTQYALLNELESEFELFVGDEKQSIYAFRGADVDLFRERSNGVPTLRLSQNWRSNQGIRKFVDDLFDNLWTEYHRMDPKPVLDFNEIELPAYPNVEIWRYADKDVRQTATLVKEFLEADEAPPRATTILVRSGKFAAELHGHLERIGISSQIVGGTEKFYVRMEIRDMANVLRSLHDPYDDFSLLATLRSPLVDLSMDAITLLALQRPVIEAISGELAVSESDKKAMADFASWFGPLSAYADRLNAWEVLSEVFAKSPFLPALARRRGGERMVANVRKLFALATKQPELGAREFAEQIREIQRIAHKEGDAALHDDADQTLTIMTIHKSKGLEFESVILADTHSRLGGRAKSVEANGQLGLVGTKFGRQESLLHRWLSQQRKDRETAEELRVLYVAMTRARNRLAVVAHEKARNSNSLAAVIGQNFDMGPPTPAGLTLRTPRNLETD